MTAVLTDETLELWRAALSHPQSADALRKAGITVGTGLVYFDLRVPSQKQYPVLTPLRNTIPRKQGRGGTAVNWRVLTGINTTVIPAGVSEGNRNAVMSVGEADFLRSYRGLGMENSATFEADYAAQNFEDVRALAGLTGLQALMISEEYAIIGGNTSLALGTTPTPALAAVTGQGGAIGTGITVAVVCVALTNDGNRYASLANGIKQTIARTNADGSTDTINGGTAQPSAEATQATSSNSSSIQASVAAVPGAVAYAWYAGNGSGNAKLYAITTLNSVLIQSLPGTGQAASGLAASDNSKDALTFDGLITFAATSANGGYFKQLATGTPGTGTKLTSDTAGGVTELNDMFAFYWDNFKLSPDEIWCHRQEQQSITKLVIANGGAPLLRMTVAADADKGDISGGVRVSQVLNPITGKTVALKVHPDLPAGTLVARIKQLDPGTYPGYNPGTTLEMDTRREYYQLEWPLRTRKYEYGVYVDEVLIPWAAFAFGAIGNIAPA